MTVNWLSFEDMAAIDRFHADIAAFGQTGDSF
jgi:hypothetical protein